jgi:hypothetical protein
MMIYDEEEKTINERIVSRHLSTVKGNSSTVEIIRYHGNVLKQEGF